MKELNETVPREESLARTRRCIQAEGSAGRALLLFQDRPLVLWLEELAKQQEHS